ncbi:MAG: hypothetical protein RLY72_233 [Planctomycetota bacterium]|jgi:hypothetical protein
MNVLRRTGDVNARPRDLQAESGIELELCGTRPSAPAQQKDLMLLYAECLLAIS